MCERSLCLSGAQRVGMRGILGLRVITPSTGFEAGTFFLGAMLTQLQERACERGIIHVCT